MWFDLKLPSPVIDEIRLSSLQLEAIVYACQQHKNILTDGSRAGFLVGEMKSGPYICMYLIREEKLVSRCCHSWFVMKGRSTILFTLKGGKAARLVCASFPIYFCCLAIQRLTNTRPCSVYSLCDNVMFCCLGDGAGVGKGRTIAGIIYQNYLEGRKKALW